MEDWNPMSRDYRDKQFNSYHGGLGLQFQNRNRDGSNHVELYIAGLPPEMESVGLENLFSKYGKVTKAFVPPEDRQHRMAAYGTKYGFVHMNSVRQASEAVQALDGFMIGKYQLIVKVATPKEKRAQKQERGNSRSNYPPPPLSPLLSTPSLPAWVQTGGPNSRHGLPADYLMCSMQKQRMDIYQLPGLSNVNSGLLSPVGDFNTSRMNKSYNQQVLPGQSLGRGQGKKSTSAQGSKSTGSKLDTSDEESIGCGSSQGNKTNECAFCYKKAYSKCGRCKTYYCDVKCQTEDWPKHKDLCHKVQDRNQLLPHDLTELEAHIEESVLENPEFLKPFLKEEDTLSSASSSSKENRKGDDRNTPVSSSKHVAKGQLPGQELIKFSAASNKAEEERSKKPSEKDGGGKTIQSSNETSSKSSGLKEKSSKNNGFNDKSSKRSGFYEKNKRGARGRVRESKRSLEGGSFKKEVIPSGIADHSSKRDESLQEQNIKPGNSEDCSVQKQMIQSRIAGSNTDSDSLQKNVAQENMKPDDSLQKNVSQENKKPDQLTLKMNKAVSVFISHVDNPAAIFVQLVDHIPILKQITDSIEKQKLTLNPDLATVTIGQMYLCEFDGTLSRSQVISVEPSHVTILYIDYGNTERVDRRKLHSVGQEVASYPAMAVQCCLMLNKPNEWSGENISVMKRILRYGEKFTLIPLSKSGSTYNVQLFSSNQKTNIVDYLMDNTAAQSSSKLPDKKGIAHNTASKSPDKKGIAHTSKSYSKSPNKKGIFHNTASSSSQSPNKKSCAHTTANFFSKSPEEKSLAHNTANSGEVSKLPAEKDLAHNTANSAVSKLPAEKGLAHNTANSAEVSKRTEKPVITGTRQSLQTSPLQTSRRMMAADLQSILEDLKVGQQLELLLCEFNTPVNFWVQIFDRKILSTSYIPILTAAYINTAASQELYRPVVGELVMGKFSYDCQWYRAEVLEVDGESARVRYVDLGRAEWCLSCDDLRAIPPEQASDCMHSFQCALADINTPASEQWSKYAVEMLKLDEMKFTAVVRMKESKLATIDIISSHHPHSLLQTYPKSLSPKAVTSDHKSLLNSTPPLQPISPLKQDSPLKLSSPLQPIASPLKSDSPLQSICPLQPELQHMSPHFAHSDHKSLKGCTLPLDGESVECGIYAAKGGHEFYVVLLDKSKELEAMQEMINLVCSQQEPGPLCDAVEPQDLVLVQFSQDKLWYRGCVKSVKEDYCSVFFVDYGNTEEKIVSSLRHLPDHFLQFPAQAIRCCLSGWTQPVSPEKNDLFRSYCSQKMVLVQAIQCYVLNDTVYEVELFTSDRVPLMQLLQDSQSVVKQMSKTVVTLSDLPVMLPEEKQFEGIISFFTSPDHFFAQALDQAGILYNELRPALNEFCESAKPMIALPEVGSLYCSKYEGDWYRCALMKMLSHDMCSVLFIDYGNEEQRLVSELRHLPDQLSQWPLSTFRCTLYGVKAPVGGWCAEAIKYGKERQNQPLIITMHNQTSDSVYQVSVSQNQQDFSQVLIAAGIADSSLKDDSSTQEQQEHERKERERRALEEELRLIQIKLQALQ